MKKYIFIITAIIILIFGLSFGVQAETFFAEVSDDKVLMRNTAEDGSVELKAVEIYNLGEYRYFGVREMAECCNADIEWDESTKTVLVSHNELIISLKNNSSEIYINGNKYDFGYPVIIIEGKSYAPLELYKAFTGELRAEVSDSDKDNSSSVTTQTGTNADLIRIKNGASGLINDFKLSDPDRIVLDIADINITENFPTGNTYEKVRHFKGSDGVTRIVFDLKSDYEYRLDYEGDDLVISISHDGSFIIAQDLVEFRNNSIIINTDSYTGYKISRGTDPFTINALIPGRLINESFVIDVGGELVKNIKVSVGADSTEITAELSGQCAFELEKLSSAFIIGIYEPVVKGIEYHNLNGEITILADKGIEINGVKHGSSEIIINLNDANGLIKPGQIYINDDTVKSIYVTKNGNSASIRVVTKTNKFASVSKDDNKIILNNNDYSGKLVVISAGHGGRDPGAIVNGVYESTLNLSIAEKLSELLDAAGAKVHMIRTDDTFVSLEDRTRTANNMKADLFISIHCNTLENKDFDGLMTLVHSGRINYDNLNGKTAGTIIHEEVIASTGATDREVRNRDKIIVLKDTAMPAVEIECGFLTNDAEFGKLITDSYQWKIAEGTAAGVLKVLDLMD